MNAALVVDLIPPAAMIVAGIGLALFPRLHRARAERRHAARLAELDAGAKEVFFEERRALLAYPPARKDEIWRRLGAILFAIAAFEIYTLLAG